MKTLLRALALPLCLLALTALPGRATRAAGAGAPASRPSFVVVVADDMSYHDLGCWGNADVRTPNLDRLAAQGMRLTHAFTPAPMCSPTRHALYTGLFPVKNGGHPNHSRVKPGTRSVVHHLKALGYRVGLAGKTHIQPPQAFPFERLGEGPNGEIQPAVLEEFINRDPAQPYCLFVCSHEPHGPWSKGNAAAYDPAKLKLPPYLVDTPETRAGLAKYYAEITHLDALVGRVTELVDRGRGAANTLLLFLSEQGSSFPHAKWTLYDAGIRAAGIARWPGKVQPGSVSGALVQYVDVLPTFLEAAGAPPAAGLDGRGFLGVLTGKTGRHREHVFAVMTSRGIINGPEAYPIRSARDGRYKLILNLSAETEFSNVLTRGDSVFESWRARGETDAFAREQVRRYLRRPPLEFYDLDRDPFELKNLAEAPEHRQRIARLRGVLEAWMREQGDEGVRTELAVPGRRPGRANRR